MGEKNEQINKFNQVLPMLLQEREAWSTQGTSLEGGEDCPRTLSSRLQLGIYRNKHTLLLLGAVCTHPTTTTASYRMHFSMKYSKQKKQPYIPRLRVVDDACRQSPPPQQRAKTLLARHYFRRGVCQGERGGAHWPRRTRGEGGVDVAPTCKRPYSVLLRLPGSLRDRCISSQVFRKQG